MLAQSDTLLERYGCEQTHTTFAALGDGLPPLELSPEELLGELVAGADHLIERALRVLSWIMRYREPHLPWAGHPVAGTP